MVTLTSNLLLGPESWLPLSGDMVDMADTEDGVAMEEVGDVALEVGAVAGDGDDPTGVVAMAVGVVAGAGDDVAGAGAKP